MVQNLDSLVGSKTVQESMSSEEIVLFSNLKEALLSKNNRSRHSDLRKQYNFEYADSEVLLGYVRHSCLGCYPEDVAYIKDCHHRPGDEVSCSLWLYRGGKVHKDEIPLYKGRHTAGYVVGVPDEERRVTEIFMFFPNRMFRWVPRIKSSITDSSAEYLAEKVFNLIAYENKIPKGWECVPNNEG